MKRRLLAVLLSLTLAGTFMACGGSKEGAETATVADQSISDISTAPTVTKAATDSKTTAGDTTASQVTKPAATDSASTTESGQSDVITPIPAQEITDGTAAAGTTADGTAGTAAGTTADGATVDGTQGTTNSQKMITTADINVREEADFEGDILGGYDEGDEITVIGAEGEWYIVEYDGEKGYVYSKYLKSADAPTGSSTGSSDSTSESNEDSEYSKYGKLVDGDGDPVNLKYYDGSYEIYDEDGNQVFIEGVND
ncbi:MAG: SH3 domain-containing protein [Lachnospiraceae bacterium]|nr:SH3 domain-containing protein [Lachnospiraceae bacterium]